MTRPVARSYQRLSRVAKLAYALDRLRDDPITCPGCSMSVLPRDLEAHQARCAGRAWESTTRAIGWLTWREIRALGIPKASLVRWVVAGKVRRRKGPDGRWEYGHADLGTALEGSQKWHAQRRSNHARKAARGRWRARRHRNRARSRR